MVASYSNKFVVIADYRKASSKLGQAWDYVPIEVLALAYRPLMARIEEQLGGRCEVNDIVSSGPDEYWYRSPSGTNGKGKSWSCGH